MDDFLARAVQRKYLPQWLFAGGVLLLIVSGFIWWFGIYTNPYNVYWGMLSNSLATPSVTKHVVDKSSSTGLDQYVGQQFGTNTLAYGRTTLTSATSTVKTESIGTIKDDYVRYTSIQTKQKDKQGKEFNFSNVLGRWGHAAAANVPAQSGSATPFFIQTMLGLGGGNLIPMANLAPAQRQNLLNQLHQNVVFSTSFNDVKKGKLYGRPVYTYAVDVEPVAYVGLEKAFATDLGIKTLDSIDPNNYQGQQAVKVQLTVDTRSHNLVQVKYIGTEHQEIYSSYGVPINQKLPKATISSQALQNLISHIQ